MRSSISLFEIIDVVIPDRRMFFWMAATIPAVCSNGNKTLLANSVSILLINGKPAAINGLRKLRNHLPWLVIFLIVPFNEIHVMPEPVTDEIPFFSVFFSIIKTRIYKKITI